MSVGDYFKGLPRWHWTRSLLNSWSVDVRFPLRWPPLSNSPIGGAVYAKWGCGQCGALLLPSAAASCCHVGQCISTTEQVGTSSALLTLGSLSGDQYTQFSGSGEVLVQSTRFAVGAHVNARRRIWREIRITTWADARSTCTCKLVSAHGGCTGDDAGTQASGGRSSQQGSAAAYTQTPANAPSMTLSVTLVADLEKQNLTKFLVVKLKNKIQVLKLGASFARNWIEDTVVMKSCGFVNTVGQGQFVLIFFDEVCKLFGASSSWLATCTFCPSARGLHWRFGEVEVETEVDTSATQNEYGNWVSGHCLGVTYIGFIWL